MRCYLIPLTFLWLISGCAPVESPDRKVIVEEFDCDVGPYAAAIPREFSKLRQFAPLESEQILETTDWGDYKTTVRELRFDGLVIVVITFSNGRPYMLSSIRVTAPQWQVTGPLRVDMKASKFFSPLGKPRVSDGIWNISQIGPTELFLTVRGGKFSVIEYACYTG